MRPPPSPLDSCVPHIQDTRRYSDILQFFCTSGSDYRDYFHKCFWAYWVGNVFYGHDSLK